MAASKVAWLRRYASSLAALTPKPLSMSFFKPSGPDSSYVGSYMKPRSKVVRIFWISSLLFWRALHAAPLLIAHRMPFMSELAKAAENRSFFSVIDSGS